MLNPERYTTNRINKDFIVRALGAMRSAELQYVVGELKAQDDDRKAKKLIDGLGNVSLGHHSIDLSFDPTLPDTDRRQPDGFRFSKEFRELKAAEYEEELGDQANGYTFVAVDNGALILKKFNDEADTASADEEIMLETFLQDRTKGDAVGTRKYLLDGGRELKVTDKDIATIESFAQAIFKRPAIQE